MSSSGNESTPYSGNSWGGSGRRDYEDNNYRPRRGGYNRGGGGGGGFNRSYGDRNSYGNERGSYGDRNRSSGGGGGDYERRDMGEKTSITIPSSDVGKVIGRQGSTIKGIQNHSGAQVKVHSKQDCPGENTNVDIFGSVDQREKAKDLIDQVLNGNGFDGGRTGGGSRGGGARSGSGGGYRRDY